LFLDHSQTRNRGPLSPTARKSFLHHKKPMKLDQRLPLEIPWPVSRWNDPRRRHARPQAPGL
jgi:hypothetical protein